MMTLEREENRTTLLVAIENGDRDAAYQAIRAGDDVNARDDRPIIGDGVTALHLAALDGDYLLIRELIKYGAELDAQCGTGQTPLWFACNGNHYRAIDELLTSGADPTVRCNDGYRPRDRVLASDAKTIAMIDEHTSRQKR